MSTIRQVLLKLKWDPRFRLEDCELLIRHRGAPGDVKLIQGSSIKEIGKGFFIYEEEGVKVHIPFHRVLEIRTKLGKVLYRRS
ncbi:MAG: hypothetical protein DRN06_00740 [Thermoprotei archaeon]|nr:MAG: hypothetical protein DRN06_00740 [Thermoprotei archaeon]